MTCHRHLILFALATTLSARVCLQINFASYNRWRPWCKPAQKCLGFRKIIQQTLIKLKQIKIRQKGGWACRHNPLVPFHNLAIVTPFSRWGEGGEYPCDDNKYAKSGSLTSRVTVEPGN